ncbi:MAG: ComF family protein [Candidatus Levybacteria bacterium]|nr:ComF family protein [Candidatus Levybacteria bacterium]
MLDFFVSLLYPKKCVRCKKNGAYICDNCFAGISFLEYQLCAICQKGSIDGLTHPKCRTKYGIDGIISSIAYKGIVKKLLYQFKYPPYLSDLKQILGRLFYEGLIQQESFMKYIEEKSAVITSVPLHISREKKRGYNQSELLGLELSKRLNLPFSSGLLIRKVRTKPQFELTKEERKSNILGVFIVAPKFEKQIKGKRIILVDDISTTGSTLRECAKILKKSGAEKVLGVTLAHEG